MLDTNWQRLYLAALFEPNPDRLLTCIEAAQQAITAEELRADITTLERRKLTDARVMLTILRRIGPLQCNQAA
jgi:hypothetical protein